MGYSILEFLIPDDRARADRMDATTDAAYSPVLAHLVDHQTHRTWPKFHVAIQCQYERVFQL